MILSICKKVTDAFDRGLSASFWYMWNQHVPSGIRKTDRKTQRLEFLLHVHFAALPLRKGLPSNEDMVKLKVGLTSFLVLYPFTKPAVYYHRNHK